MSIRSGTERTHEAIPPPRGGKLYTYQDYLNFPEDGNRHEILEGVLHVSPAPSMFHQLVIARMFVALTNHATAKKLGVVFCSPFDVIFSELSVCQPDFLYIRKARLNVVNEKGSGAPDIVVEVLSPSTRKVDLGEKRKVYVQYGVPEYWVVDPEAERIEWFDLPRDPEKPCRIFAAPDALESPLLPGFVLPLAPLFAPVGAELAD